MNELKLNGTQEFMGKEIPIILGGFGEGCKVVTDKMVAEIHGMKTTNIRRDVLAHFGRFKEGIDFIDLKATCSNLNTLDLTEFGYAKQSITQATNIFIFSERGYQKLVGVMNNQKAWDIQDKLLDEYFTMKEVIKQLTRKQELALELFEGGSGAIVAHKELLLIETEELKEKHRLQLEAEIDGNNKILSGLQEVVNILGIKGLNPTILRDWMISKGLGKMVKFEGDKNRTFVPNELFYEYVCKKGYSYTGTTLTNKPKVIYSTRFVTRIQSEHIASIIDFVKINSN